MDAKKMKQYKEALLAKRREIAGEVKALREEGLQPVSDGPMDSGDDAAVTYSQQVSMGISEAERKILREIDEALDRIDSGGFGKCGECGESITPARLKAVPYASLCIHCKSEEERKNR